MAISTEAATSPLDRLPTHGNYVFSNPVASLLVRLIGPTIILLFLAWVLLDSLSAMTHDPAVGRPGPLLAFRAAAAVYCVILGHGIVTNLRLRRCRRISRELGLKTLVVMPLHPRLAARLYRSRLPLVATSVVEVHVDTSVKWWSPDDPPELRATRAGDRFQTALHQDYAVVLDFLLPASPDWAFAVSTWHRMPAWIPKVMARAQASDLAVIRPGPVPAWIARGADRNRRQAQRRMFGALFGRPVNDPACWTSYFLAPVRQRTTAVDQVDADATRGDRREEDRS